MMTKINLRLRLISFFFIFGISIGFGQKNIVDCYVIRNQVNKLLAEQDTLRALRLYETMDQERCRANGYEFRNISKTYFEFGEFEKSKIEMEKAVRAGVLGEAYFGYGGVRLKKEIEQKFGSDFFESMLELNDRLIEEKLAKNKKLIYELRDIYDTDQALRKDKKNKVCRRYAYNRRLNLKYDTTLNHENMMSCFFEYKQKDSSNLQRLANIIDSLGFVPGDDMIFAMIPLPPLICHTARYQFENFDSLLLKSVKIGTISPGTFAWHQGYFADYYMREPRLYFTINDTDFLKFDDAKIKEINKLRLEIGLPLCPAVVWNTNCY